MRKDWVSGDWVSGGDARLKVQWPGAADGSTVRLDVEGEGPHRWYWRLIDSDGVMLDEGVEETWANCLFIAHGSAVRLAKESRDAEARVVALDPGAGFYTPKD